MPARAPLVLGSSQPADSFVGRLQRLVYAEAFRRMDLPWRIEVMPLQRLSAAADQGLVDGEVARLRTYAADHPELVRVEEPLYDVHWALFAPQARVPVMTLQALAESQWRVSYLRGVAICERTLAPLLQAQRLTDVGNDAQAVDMLRLGRVELHCTGLESMLTLQAQPENQDLNLQRVVVDLGQQPVFPYLHRRHAALAPQLAAVLRQLRSEGLVARYREQVMAEVGRR